MSNRAFEGPTVRLRAIEPEDWETWHALSSDEEMRRLDGIVGLPAARATSRTFAEAAGTAHGDDCVDLLVQAHQGPVLGRIGVSWADRRNRVFRYGIGLTAPYRRQGFGREALLLLLRFYFDELDYWKAEAEVHASNEGSIGFHQKLGFVEEGRRRQAIRISGVRHDAVLFGLTADELGQTNPW